MDYGFARERLQGRFRTPGEPFTFGYIGTHIPAKGIHDLIQAFGYLKGDARLRIWGRPHGRDTEALQVMAASSPKRIADSVEWLPEYRNQDIICDVFNRCDVIVVPSIWAENSPLVIHEAQQARVPVITANFGGMAEYVHHEVNGLLFEHRSIKSLSEQMQRCIDSPELIKNFGKRGYLYTETGDVQDINTHASEIERLYNIAIKRNITSTITHKYGPWRITFDTNPSICNLQCIMCEEHSPFKQHENCRPNKCTPHRIMSFDIIKRVVESIVPYGLKEIIPSTMGEPLLYEHFDDILKLCDQYNIKLNLTTNGTFPRFGVEAWAHKLVPRASDVKISWNGASKAANEAIMLGSNWETMLNNVRTFIKVRDDYASAGGGRCGITFQLTFMESNVAELADIVKLALDIGVDRVKGHHLWPHFTAIEKESMRRDCEAIQRWNKAAQAAGKIAAEAASSTGRCLLLENFFQLEENASEDISPGAPCPFLGQEAWISACGRFDPCCAPDARRRTLGEFGNLIRQEFMEIWNGEAYRQFVKTYRTRSLCLRCNMRKAVDGAVWTGND
jgi:MoaA/NifB/PqqE/SkfB family radical SAM enzyme